MLNPTAEAVIDAIQRRRTIPYKQMRSEPIREEDLNLILEAANWAPSHKHTEPWRFFLFTGEGRKHLADLLARTYKAAAGDKFMERKYQKCLTRPVEVPLTIAVIMRPSEKPLMPEYEEILAMGCAVQNLCLAAHALDIGTSWSTPGYYDHENIREYFQLGERDRCFGFLYMGYMGEQRPASVRRPVANKVTRIDS